MNDPPSHFCEGGSQNTVIDNQLVNKVYIKTYFEAWICSDIIEASNLCECSMPGLVLVCRQAELGWIALGTIISSIANEECISTNSMLVSVFLYTWLMGVFQTYMYHESIGYDWMYIACSNKLDLWQEKKIDQHWGWTKDLRMMTKHKIQLMLETTAPNHHFYFSLSCSFWLVFDLKFQFPDMTPEPTLC
jgi:hypothetical protein